MDSIRPKLILVPTDFSEPAAHALRFASRLAERVGARIRLMYADYFVPPVDFSATAAVEYALTSDEAADEAKKQLIRLAEEYLPKSVAYETRVVIDSPVPAIVDEARNCGADLVVMGTHGRTGFRRLIVGSVTESVMRMVNVPILAISPLTDERRLAEPFSRVVCAVDDSPESREALRLSATPADIVDRCQYKLLPADHPSEQVVELARLVHADLIAAGCVSNRTTSEVMRGTMAERIVERSDCPVLVVNEIAVLRNAAKAELATA